MDALVGRLSGAADQRLRAREGSMAIFSALDWPIRLLLAAVVTAAVGTGVFLLVRTSGNGDQPAAVVATMTVEASPTLDQLSPTPQPPATEEPTLPPPTEVPPTV